MRVSSGIIATAALFLAAGAAGFLPGWAMAVGAVLVVVGGVGLVIALEDTVAADDGIAAFAQARSASAPRDTAA